MPLTTEMPTLGVKQHTHEYEIEADTITAEEALTGTPGTISPDDTAAEGVATSLARSDHRHAITAGAPAALTKTATSAESAGTGFARDAHVHATSALPWGVVARFEASTSQTGVGSGITTSFTVTFTADSTRLYKAVFLSGVLVSDASEWTLRVYDGTNFYATVWRENGLVALERRHAAGAALLPALSGSQTLSIRTRRDAGAGTIDFEADSTAPRQFWIEDIGPR